MNSSNEMVREWYTDKLHGPLKEAVENEGLNMIDFILEDQTIEDFDLVVPNTFNGVIKTYVDASRAGAEVVRL